MSQKIAEKLEEQGGQDYGLTEFEYAMLMELDILLQFHSQKAKIMENWLRYIAIRHGFTDVREGYRLAFDIKPNEDGTANLTISEFPIENPE